jgi:hypothetical protein
MPRLMKGWIKKWFYLRNDASAPLPMFTDNCLLPYLPRGTGGQEGPRQVAPHVQGPSAVTLGGVDRGAPPVDIF